MLAITNEELNRVKANIMSGIYGQGAGLASQGVGAGGGGLGNNITISNGGSTTIGQVPWMNTREVRSVDSKWLIGVDEADNGFIVRFGLNGGYVNKVYICATPQEIADRILTCMVEGKMEK